MDPAGPEQHLDPLLVEAGSVREYLDDYALRASHRLGADTEVSVSLRHRGHDRVVASSSERAARCDEVEHAQQSGPCVTAMDHLRVVVVPDLVDDTRWGTWRQAALDAGFRSSAGVPVHVTEGAEIALNLYSEQVDPWDAEMLVRADMFAQDVARTVRLCLQIADLTRSAADARAALEAIDRALHVSTDRTTRTLPEALENLHDAAVARGADPADIARDVLRSASDADPGRGGAT